MFKTPTKQIYLLSIIVGGIIALSAYSTYAIFTFESSTSDIVTINTPNGLNIYNDKYEYKQLNVPKNSYIDTDIDIYNNNTNPLCYSIWYKSLTDSKTKIKIYQNTNGSVETNGTIDGVSNKRINLIITNDNEFDVKINIGLVYSEKGETCQFNISEDKLPITSTINNPKILSDELIKNTQKKTSNAGYLTYKDIERTIDLPDNEEIYISKTFDYKDELFTLTNSEKIAPKDIALYESKDNENYYTCLNTENCRNLFRITKTSETEEKKKIDNGEETIIKHYHISKYDTLVGYLGGEVGLRKIDNDYIFYGDNPNNFVYYNCANELDTKTCELWRILGFTYDKKENKYLTRLIKDESIGKHIYDEKNQTWNESSLNKYLNKDYKLQNTYYLKEVTFNQENITDLTNKLNETKSIDKENKSFVTIMNLTDYLNASVCEKDTFDKYDNVCLNNNWLNKNTIIADWTNTINYKEPYKEEETEELITPSNNTLYSVSDTIKEEILTTELNVRPIVHLTDRTFLISGDGTIDNPYKIR